MTVVSKGTIRVARMDSQHQVPPRPLKEHEREGRERAHEERQGHRDARHQDRVGDEERHGRALESVAVVLEAHAAYRQERAQAGGVREELGVGPEQRRQHEREGKTKTTAIRVSVA